MKGQYCLNFSTIGMTVVDYRIPLPEGFEGAFERTVEALELTPEWEKDFRAFLMDYWVHQSWGEYIEYDFIEELEDLYNNEYEEVFVRASDYIKERVEGVEEYEQSDDALSNYEDCLLGEWDYNHSRCEFEEELLDAIEALGVDNEVFFEDLLQQGVKAQRYFGYGGPNNSFEYASIDECEFFIAIADLEEHLGLELTDKQKEKIAKDNDIEYYFNQSEYRGFIYLGIHVYWVPAVDPYEFLDNNYSKGKILDRVI